MTKSVRAKVTYRDSDFTYGGGLEARTIDVTKPSWSETVFVELGGPEGWVGKMNLTLPPEVAIAMGHALITVGGGHTERMKAEY